MRYSRQTILRRWLHQLAANASPKPASSTEPPADASERSEADAAQPAAASERSEADAAPPAAASERSEACAAEPPPDVERERSYVAAGFRLPGEKRSARKRKKKPRQA